MTRGCWVGLVIFAAVAIVAGASAAEEPTPAATTRGFPDYLTGEEERIARLYQRTSPSVVTLFTSRQPLEEDTENPERAIGSGVLISPRSHILTAAHVVQGAARVMAKTLDGTERLAEVLFSDANADIALVQLLDPDPTLTHAPLGDSDRLAIGQWAFAIGSPYGLETSFSVGHISGFREFDNLYDGTIRAEFIQTDAAINLGSSGGPLFNSRGEVIGIASRIMSLSGGSQGLGFVVAINTAKALLSLEDRVWLGIEVVYLGGEMISRLLGYESQGGLLVQRVSRGSPADRAGLRGGSVPAHLFGRDFLLGGDLIVEFAAEEVCDSRCLVEAGPRLRGLETIPVKFLRGGTALEVLVDVSSSRRNFLVQ